MTPVTSSNNYSWLKSLPSKETMVADVERDIDSNENDVDTINNQTNIANSNYDYVQDSFESVQLQVVLIENSFFI